MGRSARKSAVPAVLAAQLRAAPGVALAVAAERLWARRGVAEPLGVAWVVVEGLHAAALKLAGAFLAGALLAKSTVAVLDVE